jgi:hypothetical protein
MLKVAIITDIDTQQQLKQQLCFDNRNPATQQCTQMDHRAGNTSCDNDTLQISKYTTVEV